jgi:hypothetical protein
MPNAVVALTAVSRPFLDTEVGAKANLLFAYRDIERLLQKDDGARNHTQGAGISERN